MFRRAVLACFFAMPIASCADLSSLTSSRLEAGVDGSPTADACCASEGGAETGSDSAALSYAATVLQDAPLAYYRLGESVTPVARDSSPAHLDGVYQGGVTLGVPGAIHGDPDTAAAFDGVNAEVDVMAPASFDFTGTAPFSLEVWVNHSGTGLGLLGKSTYTSGTGYAGWFLAYNRPDANESLDLWRTNQPSVSDEVTTAAPGAGFHHIVATFDGYTMRLYVDGAAVANSTSNHGLGTTAAALVLGASTNWGRFGGVLDEVAVYGSALSVARIGVHYAVGTRGP